jgi:ribosome-associated translation inhibitor RaiA
VQLAIVHVMQIRVSGIDASVTGEKRAYAEYRFFAAIAPYETRIRAIDVVLTRQRAANRQFLCTVRVDLSGGGDVKTQARAVHPIAAIDRAAERTAWLVGHHSGQRFSLKSHAFSS